MALNPDVITQRINSKLKSIGIEPTINGEPSHTANLVSLIVNEIIRGIMTQAEVETVVNTTVTTTGGPNAQTGTGFGTGKGIPGSIK